VWKRKNIELGRAGRVRLHGTTLVAGERVQMWLADLSGSSASLGGAENALSCGERIRFGRIAAPTARQRRLLARYALRSVLAEYLSVEPASVPLVEEVHGKPGLACPGPAFNLSHSGALAAIAVSEGAVAVGVDVELLGRRLGRLPMRALTAAEATQLERSRPGRREEAFLRCWTVKEAYAKGVGAGLGIDPRSVEVCLQAGTPALAGIDSGGWGFAYFNPGPGAVGAVALRRGGHEG
jgi:4'-phosphopantetheinyl transferase